MRVTDEISFDDFDEIRNPKPEETDFDLVVETAISRRGVLSGVLTFGTSSFILGMPSLSGGTEPTRSGFEFTAVPASTSDTIIVPEGFEWKTVLQWGDKLWSETPEFDETSRGTAASQARAMGDNNDGMALFTIKGRSILVANNEYTNRKIIWGNRTEGKPETDDDILKGKMAHGVTVVEIIERDGDWSTVLDSPFNRRITPDTEMTLTGPAAGHDLMKTAADPTGTKSLGTWNNCGNGATPWGTYLACEENFNGYFSSSDKGFKIPPALDRYGVGITNWGYNWAKIDDRFDVSRNPNEPNRAGYIVEIDPSDPSSTPKKHTALGRFKHENADVQIAADGRIVVYMGDDELGEYLYKYVSDGHYSNDGDNSALLTHGTLFAAQFFPDQRGRWLPLTPSTTGMSKDEICIHTRQSASAVRATTMDRPEWVTSNPNQVEVYVALTNNKNRGRKPNRGGDETPVGGPNPRAKNRYGQIVRWVPDNQDHASTGFSWDIFALAGNPDVHTDDRAGSANINSDNMFNSPDGLSFDSNGLLWIQTDGKVSNKGDFAGMGNNQMLVGNPATGEIRRFLTGPKEAEITGITWSADRATAFVGVQHPGDKGGSNWPNGGTSVPRSSIVAIRRKDGQAFG